MKVSELIVILKNLNPDADVVIPFYQGGHESLMTVKSEFIFLDGRK